MQKYLSKYKIIGMVLAVMLSNFALALNVQAASASLYLTPSTGTHVINSTFNVGVKINSGGQVINAAEGVVNFDKSVLEIISVSKAGAIFNLWTTEPSFSNSAGTVSFGGGIPRPGYNGPSGSVCIIKFRAKKVGVAQISFVSGAVLANDGKGTNILSSMGSASFTISPRVTAPETNDDTKPTTPKEPEGSVRIKPVVTSITHPDQNIWYKSKDVSFKWLLPEDITGVSVLLNDQPGSNPGPSSDGLLDGKDYAEVEDGVNYLHVKFKDVQGWGTITHFKVQIDSESPLPFDIIINQEDIYDWPILSFEAKDELSEINKYELSIDGVEPIIEIASEKASYKVTPIKAGSHTVIVKAIDIAGNEMYSSANFTIKPIETPVIKNYTEELRSTNQFFISGTALKNVTVNIYIQKIDSEKVVTQTVESDKNGNWHAVFKEFTNGRYLAWVEAVNDKERSSESSNKVSFLVAPPIFAQVGDFVINYFTVFVSLLFLIILILFLAVFLIGYIRKKLKKETTDVEVVLHKNLEDLKKEINKDLLELNKTKTIAAKRKIGTKLKNKVDAAEKNIIKEIKDIEKILK